MSARIRKICTVVEDLVSELGTPVTTPVRRVAVAAVITNPWAGRGVVPALDEEVVSVAPGLAHELTSRLVDALGGTDCVQAFGKAAIVGVAGEIEHAGALIHTPYFGNLLRELTDGESIIVFSDERADAGSLADRADVAQDQRCDAVSLPDRSRCGSPTRRAPTRSS